MKISLTKDTSYNRINHVTDGQIVVNQAPYTSSIIVSSDTVIETSLICAFDQLTAKHFDEVVRLHPEIVILGTGNQHRNLSAELQGYFYQQKIGFEAMSTNAACRTYNLLVEDQRNVVAYLILEACPDRENSRPG